MRKPKIELSSMGQDASPQASNQIRLDFAGVPVVGSEDDLTPSLDRQGTLLVHAGDRI